MYKTVNRLFTFLIALSMPLVGYAAARMTTGGVQYTVTGDKTVTARLTVKAQGDVEIYETIIIKGKSYQTTCIGEAFPTKNDYLTSVIIPNTVTKIEKYAFRNCSNLTRMVIPNSPCEIDPAAFQGCLRISSVRTHKRDGKIDYLLAMIDPRNPIIIDPDPYPYPDPYPDPDPDPVPVPIFVNIDIDIPKGGGGINDKTFALIIGNEHYKRLAEVPFATNDAKVFKEYCEKTLRIPSVNIEFLPDATQGDIRHGISTLTNRLDAFGGEAKAIVYYAGHGIPDEKDKTAYLLPIDGYVSDVESGYSLEKLYKALSDAPSQQIVVFLDACFSGAKRDGEMLASARGVAIRVKDTTPMGNLLVFTASTGEETAICDKESQHGVFTYYLLRCLRESKGTVDLGTLSEYVADKVQKRSVIINSGKKQTPTVLPSTTMGDSWKQMKLK